MNIHENPLLKTSAHSPRTAMAMAWQVFGRQELRVVLLGNIGSGKSASGNTLLGTSHFDCKLSACPVTQQCEAETVNRARWRITAVDTPGLTAEIVTDTTKEKLLQCLQLSAPGPHIFLLVIPLGRFTQEEKDTVQRAAQLFKEHFYTFTIILFTFKDNLKNSSISDYISTAGESLQQLLQKCGNRYHAFNNNNPTEDDQAEQLLRKMNSLVEDNFGTYYTLDDRKRIRRMERESLRQKSLRQRRHFDSDSDEEDDACSGLPHRRRHFGRCRLPPSPPGRHFGRYSPAPSPPDLLSGHSSSGHSSPVCWKVCHLPGTSPLCPVPLCLCCATRRSSPVLLRHVSPPPVSPPPVRRRLQPIRPALPPFKPIRPGRYSPALPPFTLPPFMLLSEPIRPVDLKEEFEKLKIHGLTEENLKKQAEILDKWKEELESKEKRLNDREEQVRKQEEEMEEKKRKLKEHLKELSENL